MQHNGRGKYPGIGGAIRMINFAVEDFRDCHKDLTPMFKLHWEEVGDYADKGPVDVRVDEYARMAEAGMLHLVTARNLGTAVGYIWHVLMPHWHHAKLYTAFLDVWFLHPNYRKGATGLELFRFAENAMIASHGVKKLHAGHTVKKPLENIFERLGYKLTELHYTKMVA